MARGFGRFLRQNTIALLALFIALGGTTFAAANALPRNSVGTRQLKNNAVISSKIKNNSVTGADVNESTLGTVPSATHASTADNATHATTADTAAPSGAAGGALQGTYPNPGLVAPTYHEVGAPGEPGFENGWVNEDASTETSAAFSKDAFGVIRLKGIVIGGSSGTTIFTLPAGYRPTVFPCMPTYRLGAAYVCVAPTGEVYQNGGGSSGGLLLDGMTFNTGATQGPSHRPAPGTTAAR